jgi:N-acyl-phosphatidylethanolamine-hydrolysing phospholipase D
MNHANNTPSAVTHRHEGGFRNPWPGSAPHGVGGLIKWMLGRSRAETDAAPPAHVDRPGISPSARRPRDRADQLTITWVGHSSFLVQCRGLNILTDPVWSDRASPVSFAGPHRLVPPAVPFEDLPPIDITLVSHDHYDHLDDATVRRLIGRFPDMKWLAPLRVGAFLRKRGASDVTELDWWEELETRGVSVGCTPAQHFSGRYPWNRDSTLWCGWALEFDDETRVFFAGDTGLHPEFGDIARRFGPFDMAILPIGAYEPRWFMRPVHMTPEDSVYAFQQLVDGDAGRCVMVGSHWGTFRLTSEPVMEPPALTRETWSRAGLPEEQLWILAHGEAREIGRR